MDALNYAMLKRPNLSNVKFQHGGTDHKDDINDQTHDASLETEPPFGELEDGQHGANGEQQCQ